MSSNPATSRNAPTTWRSFILSLYPDALRRTYCVPPEHFNRVPYDRGTVPGTGLSALVLPVPVTPPVHNVPSVSQPSGSAAPVQNVPSVSQPSGGATPVHNRHRAPCPCRRAPCWSVPVEHSKCGWERQGTAKVWSCATWSGRYGKLRGYLTWCVCYGDKGQDDNWLFTGSYNVTLKY